MISREEQSFFSQVLRQGELSIRQLEAFVKAVFWPIVSIVGALVLLYLAISRALQPLPWR